MFPAPWSHVPGLISCIIIINIHGFVARNVWGLIGEQGKVGYPWISDKRPNAEALLSDLA